MSNSKKLLLYFIMLLAFASTSLSLATDLLSQDERAVKPIAPPEVMPPPVLSGSYEVDAVELNVKIEGQKAQVLLRQTIRNTSKSPIELDFLAPLPLDGQVAGLTLVSNGKELVGKLYDKDEAFKVYRQIVETLKDPALIEYAGRSLFRARVFPVAPGQKTTLELSMDYLLPKDNQRVDFNFPLAGPLSKGKVIGLQEVMVSVKGSGLSGVYSPLEGAQVTSIGDGGYRAEYKLNDSPPLGSFPLFYQLDSGPVGALVLSHRPQADEDGFFLFLADPAADPPGQKEEKMGKTVIFVLDRSGSMNGIKFTQAQQALKFVLERLDEKDNFNLVDFSDSASLFKPESLAMNQENRKAAAAYVDNLRAGGGTNVGQALSSGLGLVNKGQPTYLVFLTDGQPTTGTTNEDKLLGLASSLNTDRGAVIFSFGVGFDVNARLLDRLSSQGAGFSTFVGEDESIESRVSSFFTKLTSPALTKPKLTVSSPVNRLIPSVLPDLFKGSQVTAVGRYPKGGPATFTLSGDYGNNPMTYTYTATLSDQPVPGGDFLARLWAQRRIGELIEQIDSQKGEKDNSELVTELVALSKRYGILTPYTSFLALEDQSIFNEMELNTQTRSNLNKLQDVVGERANRQRQWKVDAKSTIAAAPAPKPSQSKIAEAREMAAMTDEMVADSSASYVPPTILAGRTFFQKKGQLVESEITEEGLKNHKKVKRFSEEYFKLAKELGPEQAVLLSQNQPVVFNFQGASYLVDD
ncbi:MAG: VIT and VWA domain-containing protein [Deltaproteobacteria bacterium]|jgi:Ca-activated chloride channel family protein|nr:VIT and VWA domain-containing protein [Deltaproteobacteria bacterium]